MLPHSILHTSLFQSHADGNAPLLLYNWTNGIRKTARALLSNHDPKVFGEKGQTGPQLCPRRQLFLALAVTLLSPIATAKVLPLPGMAS